MPARPEALAASFDWYRAFPEDAQDNAGHGDTVVAPVLYIRGGAEHGLPIEDYLGGLRAAGLSNVQGHVIASSGHFTPDEQPDALARVLREFLESRG